MTEGRVDILVTLKSFHKPLTALQLHEKVSCDKVTLYRALEDFAQKGIVKKITLQGRALYYEFAHEDHHHHHIVCTDCGSIEDIEACNETSLQSTVLARSQSFVSIASHSLEFFGLCKMCFKK